MTATKAPTRDVPHPVLVTVWYAVMGELEEVEAGMLTGERTVQRCCGRGGAAVQRALSLFIPLRNVCGWDGK